MSVCFQIGTEAIAPEGMLTLLNSYQLTPQLLKGYIVDQAIAEITCSNEEFKAAQTQLCQRYQLATPDALEKWYEQQGMTEEDFVSMLTRAVRVEKFKQETWGAKVESYFLSRKSSLDQVIYSLIRTRDLGLAQELYFRIKEGEQPFSELARQYSEGIEASTGGVLGPVRVDQPHPAVSRLLAVSQPGQLWPPRPLAEWFIIVRLEKFIPAQLDEAMRRRLIDEMFETWVREQMQQMGPLRLVESATPSSPDTQSQEL